MTARANSFPEAGRTVHGECAACGAAPDNAKAADRIIGPPLFCVSRGGARFRRRAASLSTTCGSRAPGESNAQPEEAKQAEQKRPREQAPAIGKAPSKGGETAPQQTAGRQSGEHPASSAGTLC